MMSRKISLEHNAIGEGLVGDQLSIQTRLLQYINISIYIYISIIYIYLFNYIYNTLNMFRITKEYITEPCDEAYVQLEGCVNMGDARTRIAFHPSVYP